MKTTTCPNPLCDEGTVTRPHGEQPCYHCHPSAVRVCDVCGSPVDTESLNVRHTVQTIPAEGYPVYFPEVWWHNACYDTIPDPFV